MKYMKKILKSLKSSRDGILYSGKMFLLLWQNDRKYLIYLVLDILTSSVLPFINMYLVKYSVEMLTDRADYGSYIKLVIAFIAASIVFTNLQSYFNYKRDICGNLIGIKMYKNIYKKTIYLDYEMLLDKEIMEKRELALKVINEMRVTTFTQVFKIVTTNIIVLIGLVAVLSTIDFWIILIALAIIFVNTVSTAVQKKQEINVNNDFVPINRKTAYFFNTGADASINKEIRVYNMMNPLLKMYGDIQNAVLKLVQKSFRIFFVNRTVANLSNALLDLAMYILLGLKVLTTEAITVGDFSLYLSTIRTFNSSVQGLLTSYLDILNNGQYLKNYFEFMNLPTMLEDKKADILVGHSMVFTFDNVSYKYPGQDNYVLKNISIDINAGEKLAIVGENGAGKTTLVMLLMRMFNPTEGRILLNGTDIRQFSAEEYFKLFSTVFQDFKLFAFQIRDNVSSLDESGRDVEQRVDLAIDKVGLRPKVDSLKKGINTYIDKIYENDGVLLSGGESQRVAIAQALYKDAPVIILDEPTASLDPRVETEIYTKFDKITTGKTAIYITHRLGSIRFCDRAIVLKDGQLLDIGSHDELMHKCPYYAELYNMQARFYTDSETADK